MRAVCFAAVMVFAAQGVAQDATSEVSGVILTYQCERPADQSLVDSIHRRLRPLAADVRARLREGQRVDVIIPSLDKDVIALVKRTLASPAKLEFIVVANATDHQRLLELAAEQTGDTVVSGDQVIGRWSPVAENKVRESQLRLEDCVVRDGKTMKRVKDAQNVANAEILLAIEAGGAVGGEEVKNVSESFDNVGHPSVSFEMTGPGAARLQALTQKYARDPETGFTRSLAIVFDEQVLSAPRLLGVIGGRGQITGNFTREEVRFLVNVLGAGRLPVALKQPPIESPLDSK